MFWLCFSKKKTNTLNQLALSQLYEEQQAEYLRLEAHWLNKARLTDETFRAEHRRKILEHPNRSQREEEAFYASHHENHIRPYEVESIIWEFVRFWPFEPDHLETMYWKVKAVSEIMDKLAQIYGIITLQAKGWRRDPRPFIKSLSTNLRDSIFTIMLAFHRPSVDPQFKQVQEYREKLNLGLEEAMRELVACVDKIQVFEAWPFRYLILFIKLIKVYIETIDTIQRD